MKPLTRSGWLKYSLILAIGLGICFRLINLEGKVYWHDEVYTSLRAAGYTRREIDTELFQNQLLPATDLLKFQQIKPNSTAIDTIRSLVLEDPQHPPLYFLLARGWMHRFGSSQLASRSLPALLSLLSLPLMYSLGLELFQSSLVATLATTFLALSPFDLLFAQTARQYSLLTVIVIGSSWLLLQAIRRSTVQAWGWYALSGAMGLYTHPFFGLTAIGHGVYVLLMRRKGWLIGFLAATIATLGLYFPWLVVLLDNYQRASATTGWTASSVEFFDLVKLWVLSFTALFIDLDFGFDQPFTLILRLPFVLLIGYAGYRLYQTTPKSSSLFILTSILIPFLLLALPDMILGGRRSAASRYLISSFPGVQLVVAYGVAIGFNQQKRIWRWILVSMLFSSILSNGLITQAPTWWSKSISYFNYEIAQVINRNTNSSSPPIIISDRGDDFTNTGDLISLSYELNPEVQLFLAASVPNLEPIIDQPNLFGFRLSQSLKTAIEQQEWQRKFIFEPGRLWRIHPD